MSVNRIAPSYSYGMNDNLIRLAPNPIVAQRAPTTRDLAELGTLWVDTVGGIIYGLASITSNSANWTSTPAAGATTLASLDITGAAGTVLDVQGAGTTTVISSGTINFDNAGGLTTISGDLTVAGVTTIAGDFDLTSAALIDLTSTLDAAPSILLRANGGTSEQLRIHSMQGTSVNSIELDSDAGGITLVSGLASADAINLSATGGGVDIDGILQVNIASSQNAADAIVINASAGGIDITAAGAAAEDIDIVNTAGSVNLTSGEVIANSMVLTSAGGLDFTVAGTGGLDIDMVNTAGAVNISSAQAAADAIVINASGAAGGVQIQAGSAGILIGNEADTATIDIGDVVATSARTITVGGGAVATAIADTIDIGPDGATTDAGASKVVNIATGALDTATQTVNIGSGNVASGTQAVNVATGTGTKTVNVGNADGLTTVNIDSITLINDDINVDTSINTGTSTGSILIGNGAATAATIDAVTFSIDSTTASNVTVTGAGQDLTLSSSLGSVLVESTEDAANAIRLHANGGVTETIQLHSDLGTAVNSIDLLSDIGGITLTATGLATDDAINLSAVAGGIDVDAALQLNLASSEAAADAIVISASNAAGGIDITTGGGSIDLSSAGLVSMVPATATDATGPAATAAVTINANAGVATLTGFTQASTTTLVLTVTNSIVTAGSAILCSASNLGANDAQLTVTRILPGAGTFDVTLTNNGAAALNGDVLVTFWVIAA